jgi:hypothetical protein
VKVRAMFLSAERSLKAKERKFLAAGVMLSIDRPISLPSTLVLRYFPSSLLPPFSFIPPLHPSSTPLYSLCFPSNYLLTTIFFYLTSLPLLFSCLSLTHSLTHSLTPPHLFISSLGSLFLLTFIHVDVWYQSMILQTLCAALQTVRYHNGFILSV